MGRKLTALAAFLMITLLALIFASQVRASGAEKFSIADLHVYVRMQPENPNSEDGTFWEKTAKIELWLLNVSENPFLLSGNPSAKEVEKYKIPQSEWKKHNIKIYYVWDDLNQTDRKEYKKPFVPLEGEHWLFAYVEDQTERAVGNVTQFFIRYNVYPTPIVNLGEQVDVSGDYVRWGATGPEIFEQKGEITPEAAATVRLSPAPTPPAASAGFQFDFFRDVFAMVFRKTNLWILLLVLGVLLLAATKFLFRERK